MLMTSRKTFFPIYILCPKSQMMQRKNKIIKISKVLLIIWKTKKA